MRITTTPTFRNRALVALGLAAALALTTAGCTTGATGTNPAPDASTSAGVSAVVTVTDPWVKATTGGMTGVFGTLTNTGTAPLTVVSATASVAGMVELHETVSDGNGAMHMQEAEGGFELAPGAAFPLEPGANHIMLMKLNAPIAAGDEVAVTLTLSDGSTVDFTAIAKDYAGANETYQGQTQGPGHS